MPEVKILMRQPYTDYWKPKPYPTRVMVLFQLPDLRQGNVSIAKGEEGTPAEDRAVAAEISRMGRPVGEYRFV